MNLPSNTNPSRSSKYTNISSHPPHKKRKLSQFTSLPIHHLHRASKSPKNQHPFSTKTTLKSSTKTTTLKSSLRRQPGQRRDTKMTNHRVRFDVKEKVNCKEDVRPWSIGQKIIVKVQEDGTSMDSVKSREITSRKISSNSYSTAIIRDYDPMTKLTQIWHENEDNRYENVDLLQLEDWDIASTEPLSKQMQFVPNDEWIPMSLKMGQRVSVKFDGKFGRGLPFTAFIDGFDPQSRRHHVNYGDTAEWIWATQDRVQMYDGECGVDFEELRREFVSSRKQRAPPPWEPKMYGLSNTFTEKWPHINRIRIRLREQGLYGQTNTYSAARYITGSIVKSAVSKPKSSKSKLKLKQRRQQSTQIRNGIGDRKCTANVTPIGLSNTNQETKLATVGRKAHAQRVQFITRSLPRTKNTLRNVGRNHNSTLTTCAQKQRGTTSGESLSRTQSEAKVAPQPEVRMPLTRPSSQSVIPLSFSVVQPTSDSKFPVTSHQRLPRLSTISNKVPRIGPSTSFPRTETANIRHVFKANTDCKPIHSDSSSITSTLSNETPPMSSPVPIVSMSYSLSSNANMSSTTPFAATPKVAKRYPRRVVFGKETWIRGYSKSNRRYHWYWYDDRGTKHKEWDPWRRHGLKAPWMKRKQNWVRFLDATSRAYYHNYGSGKSTFDRPDDFESESEIDYDSADENGYHTGI